MKTLAFVTTLVCLSAGRLFAQEFTYPTAPHSGAKINSFVPEGWTILTKASGDLNKDNVADDALVLQYNKVVTIIKNEGDYSDTVKTKPRMLLVLFKTGDGYKLATQNTSFVLNDDNPDRDDPFDGISITNHVLQINFRLWYNIGTWFMTTSDYKFRYDNKAFVLIGSDQSVMHRATQDTEDRSFNFVTKRWSYNKGNVNAGGKTRWFTLKNVPVKTLDNFIEPYSWEVVDGYDPI